MEIIETTERVEHGIVTLTSRYEPTPEDKKRYQCADIVNHIIEFDSAIGPALQCISDAISTAEQADFQSKALERLKACTTEYSRQLNELTQDVNSVRHELAVKALAGHGLRFDAACDFNVSGYQFTATPKKSEANYIISDLFCFSEISNINMALSDAIITGEKRMRKTQLPVRLVLDLWENK